MIRGIRGAITVESNNEEEILNATEKLLREMVEQNNINANDVASIFVSATEDITAVFPAKALRRLNGFTYVPIMCMRELTIENALKKCIRVMMHVNTNKSQQDIHHIYLEKAVVLRPDLNKSNEEA